jgi:hypothetical protein
MDGSETKTLPLSRICRNFFLGKTLLYRFQDEIGSSFNSKF